MNKQAFSVEAPADRQASRASLVVDREAVANDVNETHRLEESRGWERAICAANDGDADAPLEFNWGTPYDDAARDRILAESDPVFLREWSVPRIGPDDIQAALARIVSESEGAYVAADAALVTATLALSDVPTTLTARGLPAFLRAWLAPASELRSRGEATPEALREWESADGLRETAQGAWVVEGRAQRAMAGRLIALMSAQSARERPPNTK